MQKVPENRQTEISLPKRESLLDKPAIYAGAFLFSIAVYIDTLRENSAVMIGWEWLRQALLDLGHHGPITSLKMAISHGDSTGSMMNCPTVQAGIMTLAIIGLTIITFVGWGVTQKESTSEEAATPKTFTK